MNFSGPNSGNVQSRQKKCISSHWVKIYYEILHVQALDQEKKDNTEPDFFASREERQVFER